MKTEIIREQLEAIKDMIDILFHQRSSYDQETKDAVLDEILDNGQNVLDKLEKQITRKETMFELEGRLFTD